MRTRILLVFGLIFLALALGGVVLSATGALSERSAAYGTGGMVQATPRMEDDATRPPMLADAPAGTSVAMAVDRASEPAARDDYVPAPVSGGSWIDRIINLVTIIFGLIGSALSSPWLYEKARQRREAHAVVGAAGVPAPAALDVAGAEVRQQGPREELRVAVVDGRVLSLQPGRMTIGRSGSCDLTISETRVSRQHAEIRYDGRDCLLVDLGSTNGTTLNGQPLHPQQAYPMAPGSVVALGGQVAFRLETSVRH